MEWDEEQKVYAEFFKTLKDDASASNIFIDATVNHWIQRGFDDDQARFICCHLLGWKPPKGWRENNGYES